MDDKVSSSKAKLFFVAITLLGLGVAGYKYLDSDALAQAWSKFSWTSIGWLLWIPAFYLFFKSVRFAVLMAPSTKVAGSRIMLGYAASQAASLLPGGVAMRAAMMHRLGVPVEESSGPILANSASDQFLLLSTGLVLCYHYPNFRTSAFVLSGLLLLLIVLLSVRVTRKKIESLVEAGLERLGQAERLEAFYHNLHQLADTKLWAKVMFWTLLANSASVVALCMVVHSFGFEVEPWPLTAAFVVPGLIGRLSPLPAGAGVTEAGMIGFMAAQTSMSYEQAAVATLVFRIVDIVLPAIYGGLCQLLFVHRETTAPARNPA